MNTTNSTSIDKDSLKHLCKTCTKRRVGSFWHYCKRSSGGDYTCNLFCKILKIDYKKEYPNGLQIEHYNGFYVDGTFPATVKCTAYTKDKRVKE